MIQPKSKSAYRADIDGLRALAVLPVVLYHAGIAGFSGGFVGVDIFFVISGFLIAGIIAREVDEGRFSLWHFYERRARRILPALFALVLFVLAAASALFLPGDFEDVPKSALAALFFLGNLWFFSQTGYFQGAAETMPLLHTWSLGVEEQFYIFFPLGLVLIAAVVPQWRIAMVWLAAMASFGWALVTQADPDGFAFYMLPPRGWELLAGSLLALGAIPPVASRPVREALAWTGIALIGFAVFTYDSTTTFPGLAAVPPVLGAALLIHCAPGTSAGRALAWRPAVWIGLISYSLYLWHWPLIVFTEYAQGSALSPWQSVLVIAVSILASWASLKWIETPWRDGQRHSRKEVFSMSAAGFAGLGTLCLALIAQGPWASRFPETVGRIASGAKDTSPLRDQCLKSEYAPPQAACTLGANTAPDAVVWGDSHGVEFAWVLGERAEQEDRAIEQRTLGSCPPIPGFVDGRNRDCGTFNDAVLAEILTRPEITTVYFAAFWAGIESGRTQAVDLLDATISRLRAAGKQVVLVGPVPAQPYDVPRTLARSAAYGTALPTPRTLEDYRKRTAWITHRYDEWRAQGVTIVDPAIALFDDGNGRIALADRPLYFDSHHLTLAGARLVLDTEPLPHKGGPHWR